MIIMMMKRLITPKKKIVSDKIEDTFRIESTLRKCIPQFVTK